MTDDRDPFVAHALRRLADSAPLPHGDRLMAVAVGAHRRHQARVTASMFAAAATVVVAALGVHTWTNTSQTSLPTPGSSAPPTAVRSSSAAAGSGAPDASSPAPASVGSPTSTPSSIPNAGPSLVVNVTTSASTVIDGDPVKILVTVTNNGSVSAPGGLIHLSVGAQAPPTGGGFGFDGFAPGCTSVPTGVDCAVGALNRGQSRSFWEAVTPRKATSVVWEVSWQSPGGSSIATKHFHRVVQVIAGIPSSQPPSSIPPSSLAP